MLAPNTTTFLEPSFERGVEPSTNDRDQDARNARDQDYRTILPQPLASPSQPRRSHRYAPRLQRRTCCETYDGDSQHRTVNSHSAQSFMCQGSARRGSMSKGGGPL